MIKGIVFDADGTLLDSMFIWDELGERYLSSLGIKAKNGLGETLFPMTLKESSVYLKNEYSLSKTPLEIEEGILEILEDFYLNEVKLKNNAAQFLEKLSQKNIPMVIATSSDEKLLLGALERLGVEKYFKAILTCSELNTSKKEPFIYLEGAKILGTRAEETAVFEDVLFALETAKKAGFICVGVEDMSSIRDREKIIATADYYIKDFTGEF